MSYTAIAAAAQDPALRDRIAAAIATQPHTGHPQTIANDVAWDVCAQPGWGEAWDYAQAANNPNPGGDPAVISDGMILAAVQQVLNG